MPAQAEVAKHDTHGSPIETMHASIASLGKTGQTVAIDDLAPADEFHIGGRKASEDFLAQLGLSAGMHVVDGEIGAGAL